MGQNKCIDCGVELKCFTSTRCYKCCNSGIKNPMYGKHRDNKGINNPMYGKSKFNLVK